MVRMSSAEAPLLLTRYTEVAQQSKARGKDDFLIAFSPVRFPSSVDAIQLTNNRLSWRLRQQLTKVHRMTSNSEFAGLLKSGDSAMSSRDQFLTQWKLA
jgi:DsbC/DsbD-like thiol-disulfide interchange protein